MRILHLEASPGWGGQEIRILREAEGMRARGHEVFFAVTSNGALGLHAKSAGFTSYLLLFKKLAWPFTLFRLLWILWKHQIDLVNTHSSLDAWIGGIAARLAGKKILRTRHLSTPVKNGWNSRVVYGTLADFVVTTCSGVIPSLSQQSEKPISLFCSVATGVDPTKIQVNREEVREFRKKWGIESTDFLVGTVCFMRSWKGIEDFLKAANALREEKGLKWVIVGGGHAEKYRALAKEMNLNSIVYFTGHLEQPFPAIASLDAFALLSTAHEGVSQAILQAAYFKKPLIATATGGLCEVCLDGKTGIQVPSFSPTEVVAAVRKLKEDRSLCHRLGAQAHQLVLEQFTFQRTLDEMETIYRRMSMKNELDWKERILQYYFFHKNKVYTYAGTALGCAALIIAYLTTGPSGAEVVKARVAFEEWKKSPTDEKLAKKMHQSLRKLPGLERAVEAEIAQTLLAVGSVEKAEPAIQKCVARLKEISPLHASFAETSLLIEKRQYQEALEKAVALKEVIEKTLDSKVWKSDRLQGGSALYVCNLLRIACLQKQLNNGPGELAALEEVKGLLEVDGESSAAAQFLQANFTQKSYSLADYISLRERTIVR
ncbi:MAG: glycosyltransferase family 4 protein [Verrucomicrobiota bacterium]|nr:glycosyltransferase family 4 protein [Verrucomicrobiota bacterium]